MAELKYFRRFRMEIDLRAMKLPRPKLPDGYVWLNWSKALLRRHAWVKYQSFCNEIDSQVFSRLGNFECCQQLMEEIISQKYFLPQTTWLLSHRDIPRHHDDCGTIQGLARSRTLGAIQNVGVTPEHRGMGLGRALVLNSLHGFHRSNVRWVYLEVTAANTPAVELYRSIGFRLTQTMYKSVPFEQLEACAGVS